MRHLVIRLTTLVALASLAAVGRAADDPTASDPVAVRRAARAAGLDSLRRVPVPEPDGLDRVLNPGADARDAAVQLGKALFWDMQVGSDGQACASCHFHAGADSRTRNQLSPGARDLAPAPRDPFGRLTSGGGPNHQLTPDDFPFHRLEDAKARTSPVLLDSDDVCSSQGVVAATFRGVVPGRARDAGTPETDPLFQVGGHRVRRVAARNTPSVVNAVFNRVNFWDGRAQPVFNGVNARGALDPDATVTVVRDGRLVPERLRLGNASLASQAVEPPRNDLEMAFAQRPFRDLGRKLLQLRPLGGQLVHPQDAVLGGLSRARDRDDGAAGLAVGYRDLIARAFRPAYWDTPQTVDGYTLMETNFSLFFGVAVQLYERTLVSDRTPFDAFMEGDDRGLDAEQLEGLLVFANRGKDRSDDPAFARVKRGNCVSCHGGPAFTDAAVGLAPDAPGAPAIELQPVATVEDDTFTIGPATALRDRGFSNTGVRPTVEDLGRGGLEGGLPLAFARQRLLGLPAAPPLPACGTPGRPPCPPADRTAVDGAFKIPGLRNVALTGPYFHNGGQATLRQVMLYYQRHGDFSAENVADLDPELTLVYLTEPDKVFLISFLEALTDPRVRDERAPFDHPQLFVPDGYADDAAARCGDGRDCERRSEIPAVGARGRGAAGLPPLGTFLGLDPHL